MENYYNKIECGDCRELAMGLPDGSVDLVVTSPPYALQRAKLYGGVSEAEYPGWMVGVLGALVPKMKEDASVFMVIRANVRDGQLSDYVLRTRLAVREAGWVECEELIWLKPDAPPLGHTGRPRRTWESVLWFSRTTKPYVDLYACGAPSKRIGFAGSLRFGMGGDSPIHQGQNTDMKEGRSKVTDTVTSYVGTMDRGVKHPAMFPRGVPEFLIKTFSRRGGVVLDPFVGSGTTCLVARDNNRYYIGWDNNNEYVEMARGRLASPSPFEEIRLASPSPFEEIRLASPSPFEEIRPVASPAGSPTPCEQPPSVSS